MRTNLLDYISLPPEVTPFEANYLAKTNRVALAFFWAHLPLLSVIAWFNDTKPLVAVALVCAVLFGPTVAYLKLRNPRNVSVIYGVTAMAMGALLVHFGQGPVQIEMHFYFFALIALLALFGNPKVIVAAATTAAAHHALLWLLLPKSVFNYDAPLWVVAVHAAFVVLESVGACYMARSFFDNVIQLEVIVRARTTALERSEAAMRAVLDNVNEGFALVDSSANICSDPSAPMVAWLGKPEKEHESVFDAFARISPSFGERSRSDWLQIDDGFLPVELALDQMPKRIETEDRILDVAYKPIEKDGQPIQFLVTLADVTTAVETERAERGHRETMSLLKQVLCDRMAFLDFFDEMASLVAQATEAKEKNDQVGFKRAVHTLKGNAGSLGLGSLAKACHVVEDGLENDSEVQATALYEALVRRWSEIALEVKRLAGTDKRVIEVEPTKLEDLELAVCSQVECERLQRMVRDLRLEPTQSRLDALAEYARSIAGRLEKSVEVRVESNGVRVGHEWSGFWSALQHAVRNSVDHGVESPDRRLAAGKSETALVRISTVAEGDSVVVELSDDGGGIDWDGLAKRASEKGLPSETREDLIAALFAQGVSTAAVVSDLSGRGVGMGALLEAVESRGGRIEVDSTPGVGTRIRCVLPVDVRPNQVSERRVVASKSAA